MVSADEKICLALNVVTLTAFECYNVDNIHFL